MSPYIHSKTNTTAPDKMCLVFAVLELLSVKKVKEPTFRNNCLDLKIQRSLVFEII